MGGVRNGPEPEGSANADPDKDLPAAGEEGGPVPESVNSHEELVAMLAEQFARADVSLRELQARADREGGTRLPRATCADMLAGRRFPRKAVMMAFLRACQVPEHRLPAWERAWERVRLARMPAVPGQYRPPAPAGQQPDGGSAVPQPGGQPAAPQAAPQAAGQAAGQAAPQVVGRVVPPPAGGPMTPPPATPAAVPSQPFPSTPAAAQPQPLPSTPAAAHPPSSPASAVAPGADGPGADGPAAGEPAPAAGRRRRRRWALLLAAPAAAATVVAAALVWPGRDTVTDDGRAFGPGGSSRFTVRIDPAGGPVRLVRRLDARVSRQRATIGVNGAPAGQWDPLPDGLDGWAEQHVDLPPSLTAGQGTLAVVNTFVSSEWDFNEFGYAVEQQIGGAWTTTDTLDVGPGHTGGEAAHGYRIAGETFRGTRTLDAPPERDGRTAPRARYEAEAGQISRARTRPGAVGASQGTVVAGLDHEDSRVDLRVYAPKDGRYIAYVTYAAGYGDAQHIVTVNGSTRFTLDYPHHGWDVWRQVTASLPLTRGWNTLRFQHHSRWAELDHVEIA
ncbi:CBM35 domain-containing protein [Nonomuraea sp. NPDC050202]|uniref:CBM35 domain-containing protein n=1 Tax=Nonomuraea sp. NPDC050202 TaxID=3155035 RepID=UPI0033FF9FFA